MRRLFLCILTMATLSACSDAVSKDEDIHYTQQQKGTISFQRSKSEALDIAVDCLPGSRTRTWTRTDATIECITSHTATRQTTTGNDVDTLLYFVNFANSGGYAIVCGDRRLPSVLAFSDHGTLSSADIANNPGLSYYFGAFGERYDSLKNCFLGEKRFTNRQPTRGEIPNSWSDVTRTPILVTTKWGQSAPYNAYAPTDKSGHHALAGCVTVALAQTVASFNKKIDWDDLHLEANSSKWDDDSKAKLFRKIGDALHNKWGWYPNGTSADMEGIPKVLKKMGFDGLLRDLRFYDDIERELIMGRPIIMGAYEIRTTHKIWPTSWYTYSRGHCWIADAFLWRKHKELTPSIMEGSYTIHDYKFFHYNWGWSGEDDGYFLEGVYDTAKKGWIPIWPAPHEQENFRWNHQYVSDIIYTRPS